MSTKVDLDGSLHPRLVLAGALAVACGIATPILQAGQANSATPQPTFTKDVAPILQRSCQSCHRPGSLAPMSLITYDDVRPWARAIKLKTSLREMPPWFIEKNVGIQRFKDDPSLSDEEIATIASWVDSGAPRGNPADMPPPRTFTDASAWSIGTPAMMRPASTLPPIRIFSSSRLRCIFTKIDT